MVTIIEYSAEYLHDFEKLNLEWLEHYNLLESHDVEVLENPQATIIDTGGYIWLAKDGNAIVGSAAIANMGHGVFELAKMAVAPSARGKGISRLLMEQCLQKAKQLNAKCILLYSNSQLKTAIALYEKYGFKHIPVTDSPFVTADVKMELYL